MGLPRTSGTGTGLTYSYLWDGKTGGVVAPNGEYTIHLTVQQGTGQVAASGPVTLDTTSPVAVISSPATGAAVSNVRQNGSTQVAVVGTVSDANFSSWTLEDGTGAAPTTWSAVANGTTQFSSATIGLWNTIVRTNGTHSLKLTVFDKAGNQSFTTVSPSVANFSMSQLELELNPSLGQQITYTSIVPFTVSQSIVIKSAAGQTVRTVLNGQSRAAGTYTDTWNGRDDQGAILADGTYFYFSPVVEGASSMTWDQSGETRAGYDAYKSFYTYPAWDPWLNQPLVLSYDFEQAGRVRVIVGIVWYGTFPTMDNHCNPPHVCLVDYAYEDSGPHTFLWNGVDPDGIVRRDLDTATVIITHAGFAKNAAVLYGSVRTAFSNLFINSTLFSPAFQTQSIDFDLTTFRNLPVTLTVKFVNQESKSVLRTITGTYNPGHIQIVWDGRADNGMWVAPGEYGLTLKAEDSNGGVARSQGLFAVQY